MRVLLVVLLLAVVGPLQTDSTLLQGSTKKELNIYKARVRVVYDFLAKECHPNLRTSKQTLDEHPDQLQMEKEHYRQLFKELIECRKQKAGKIPSTPSKQTTPTQSKQTTSTTTKQTTSTTTKQTTSTTTKQTTSTTTKQTTSLAVPANIQVLKAQIGIMHQKLLKECPGPLTSREQTWIIDQTVNLKTLKQHYAQLLVELNRCRNPKQTSSATTIPTTEQPTIPKVKPTTPITEHPTTTTEVKPTTPTTEQPATTTKVKPTTTTTKHPTPTTKVKPTTTPTTEQPTTTTEVKPTTPTTEEPATTTKVKPTTTTTKHPTPTTKVKPTTTPTTEQPTTTTKVKPTTTLTTEQPATTTKVKPTTTTTKHPTPTTKVKPTTTPTTEQPTTTTKAKPSSTTTPQPLECQQAINYTQSWRRDHSGSAIKPGGPNSVQGYACDFAVINPWFRFTGEGGNRMLDRCPKWKSCGTLVPFWTDAGMPKVVGIESTVDVYGVYRSDCTYYIRQVKVMRCSRGAEHDFIYKPIRSWSGTCNHAFCGAM